MALVLAGELDEAKKALEMAERLSPLDPILWASTVVHALADVLSGDTVSALEWAEKTLRNPRARGYWPHAVFAAVLAQAGRIEEARGSIKNAISELPNFSVSYLVSTLPTKHPGGLDPYIENLRKAGIPE
jgi:adenylate cyclase